MCKCLVKTHVGHTVSMEWPLSGPSGELAVAAANHDTLGTPRAKSGLAERGASHVTATRSGVVGGIVCTLVQIGIVGFRLVYGKWRLSFNWVLGFDILIGKLGLYSWRIVVVGGVI
jgi:hypothetical protein